ncbi:unnamed protein product [Polarella glacialis]|uniref:EF-hand domain-containing protein n=1 Tax=Polarella glacialis TaxID=89957 RepID=A0A813KW98_POLGL|nr:unnamed protein product [Polarella glacialis]
MLLAFQASCPVFGKRKQPHVISAPAEVPTTEEDRWLLEYLSDQTSSSRISSPSAGIRIGFNTVGVWIHGSHLKRYFGMTKSSASIVLLNAMPEAGPQDVGFVLARVESSVTVAVAGRLFEAADGLLGKLAAAMPQISDEVRQQFLHATFAKADINGNGTLSRPEMGAMMRKVLITMSAKDVSQMMDEADADGNNQICYAEFIEWMQASAPEEVKGAMKRSLSTGADVVKAAFRLWDANGDGSVNRKEMTTLMAKVAPRTTAKQVELLLDLIDTDDDSKIDYDEFTDFLFHRK